MNAQEVHQLNMLCRGKCVEAIVYTVDNKISVYLEGGLLLLADDVTLFRKCGEVAATEKEVEFAKKCGVGLQNE